MTRSDQDSSNQRSWDRHLRIIRGEPQEAVAALLEDDDWLIHVSISVFFFGVITEDQRPEKQQKTTNKTSLFISPALDQRPEVQRLNNPD